MKTQSFNIILPKELVTKIDKIAKKEYRNRSELIREAVRVYIVDRTSWNEIFAYGKKMGKKMGITSEEDVNKIVYEYRHGRKQA